MTAKEKAKELVDKMYKPLTNFHLGMRKSTAKQCALIAVDEIMDVVPFLNYKLKKESLETFNETDDRFADWWNEVKQEIEKL